MTAAPKSNQYQGRCYRCGEVVPAGKGRFGYAKGISRLVLYHDQECPPADVQPEPPKLPSPIRPA
jgi:hypothetical protein